MYLNFYQINFIYVVLIFIYKFISFNFKIWIIKYFIKKIKVE